jgi:hypothetical protein
MRPKEPSDQIIIDQFVRVFCEMYPHSSPQFRDVSDERYIFDLGLPGLPDCRVPIPGDLIEDSPAGGGKLAGLKDAIRMRVNRLKRA